MPVKPKKEQVKLPFALSKQTGDLILAEHAEKYRESGFTCPFCGESVFPKAIDSTITAYFSHMKGHEACVGTQHHHDTGAEWIVKWCLAILRPNMGEPVMRDLFTQKCACCETVSTQSTDQVIFDKVYIERSLTKLCDWNNTERYPDILLTLHDKPVFGIEIYRSHRVDDTKASAYPIPWAEVDLNTIQKIRREYKTPQIFAESAKCIPAIRIPRQPECPECQTPFALLDKAEKIPMYPYSRGAKKASEAIGIMAKIADTKSLSLPIATDAPCQTCEGQRRILIPLTSTTKMLEKGERKDRPSHLLFIDDQRIIACIYLGNDRQLKDMQGPQARHSKQCQSIDEKTPTICVDSEDCIIDLRIPRMFAWSQEAEKYITCPTCEAYNNEQSEFNQLNTACSEFLEANTRLLENVHNYADMLVSQRRHEEIKPHVFYHKALMNLERIRDKGIKDIHKLHLHVRNNHIKRALIDPIDEKKNAFTEALNTCYQKLPDILYDRLIFSEIGEKVDGIINILDVDNAEPLTEFYEGVDTAVCKELYDTIEETIRYCRDNKIGAMAHGYTTLVQQIIYWLTSEKLSKQLTMLDSGKHALSLIKIARNDKTSDSGHGQRKKTLIDTITRRYLNTVPDFTYYKSIDEIGKAEQSLNAIEESLNEITGHQYNELITFAQVSLRAERNKIARLRSDDEATQRNNERIERERLREQQREKLEKEEQRQQALKQRAEKKEAEKRKRQEIADAIADAKYGITILKEMFVQIDLEDMEDEERVVNQIEETKDLFGKLREEARGNRIHQEPFFKKVERRFVSKIQDIETKLLLKRFEKERQDTLNAPELNGRYETFTQARSCLNKYLTFLNRYNDCYPYDKPCEDIVNKITHEMNGTLKHITIIRDHIKNTAQGLTTLRDNPDAPISNSVKDLRVLTQHSLEQLSNTDTGHILGQHQKALLQSIVFIQALAMTNDTRDHIEQQLNQLIQMIESIY